jgi:hypothetical protein
MRVPGNADATRVLDGFRNSITAIDLQPICAILRQGFTRNGSVWRVDRFSPVSNRIQSTVLEILSSKRCCSERF